MSTTVKNQQPRAVVRARKPKGKYLSLTEFKKKTKSETDAFRKMCGG